jgi:uncharacterized protein with HEPN domain
MKKDAKVFVEHILDSIKKIKEFTRGISKKKFEKDIKLQDALIRRIEIIGEAVKNLPVNFKDKYTEIPWTEIAGMRDKLMHHYFGIDLNTVWKTLKEDMPELEKVIEKIIKINEDDL